MFISPMNPHKPALKKNQRLRRRWILTATGVIIIAAAVTAALYFLPRFGSTPPSASGNPEPPPSLAEEAELTPEMLPDILRLGTDLLNEGKTEDAIAVFEPALQFDSLEDDEDLHYNLAIAYSRVGKINAAIEQYKEALEVWPEYAEAYNNLGNLYVKQKRFDDAINAFQQAIHYMPDYAKAYNNLGTALGQQGKPNEALIQFVKAVQLDPTYVEARFNLANTYLRQDRVEEAVGELKILLRQRPDFRPAINAMQRAQLRLQARSTSP